MNFDELLQNKAFGVIDAERLQAFKEFANSVQGKSNTEIVSAFMSFSKSIPKGNPLTKEEREVIVSVVAESIPEADRAKFMMAANMLMSRAT